MLTSTEIRERFIQFFAKRGHAVVPSASLVPENDPSVLFTTAGMQPMVPYLLGQEHPLGTKIVDSQKCFRANDIEEIGDNRHTTFFEMLGNWSLGDYFKKEQLSWMFEFLVNEIKLDPNKIYVTVFSGMQKHNLPKDTESANLWKELFLSKGIDAKEVELGTEENGAKLGMQGGRIFYYEEKNWWSRGGAPENMPAGEPGGPDSEMFYEFSQVEHDPKFGEHCHPNCDCGRYLEIGNNVFMEFQKMTDGSFAKLPKQNVDFGGGLERMTAAENENPDVFCIDTLGAIIAEIEKLSGKSYQDADSDSKKAFRIIADHLRASVFLISDGVKPSNTKQGYILRRLLRRAIRFADQIGLGSEQAGKLDFLTTEVRNKYADLYFKNKDWETIRSEIIKEETKFRETLQRGLKEFEKGADPFILATTYGFPIELTLELAKEKGIAIDIEDFNKKMADHQKLSQTSSAGMFKGGLANHDPKTIKLHTAHHLLLAALQQVVSPEIKQRGSNITEERLRMDFSFDRKVTPEELKKVEDLVNEKIQAKLEVIRREMSFADAEKTGAQMEFGAKYPETVSVYFIEDQTGAFSKEFCGGPHVSNTSDLSHFKIQKEEASSAGVRRIKAVLE